MSSISPIDYLRATSTQWTYGLRHFVCHYWHFYELSRYALERSLERFPLNNLLLFTDEPRKWSGWCNTDSKNRQNRRLQSGHLLSPNHSRHRTRWSCNLMVMCCLVIGFNHNFWVWLHWGGLAHHSIYNVKRGFHYQKQWEHQRYLLPSDLSKPEDVICRFLRNRLEHDLNIKFADEVVVANFHMNEKLRIWDVWVPWPI